MPSGRPKKEARRELLGGSEVGKSRGDGDADEVGVGVSLEEEEEATICDESLVDRDPLVDRLAGLILVENKDEGSLAEPEDGGNE